jgi:tetratricopeptide (TPR) repeat protein
MDLTERVMVEANRLVEDGRSHEAIYLLQTTAAECLNQLGTMYADLWNRKDAYLCSEAAVSLDHNWRNYGNLSHVYSRFGDFQKAERSSRKSVVLSNASQTVPLFNYAGTLGNLGKVKEAVEVFRRIVQVDPDNLMAHYNLACYLLADGKYEEGWKEYENRIPCFEVTTKFRSRFSAPDWDGGMLDGKSICVFIEQGSGDFIMFSRFLHLLKTKNPARIIVEVQRPLLEICRYNYPDFEFAARTDGPDYGPAPHSDVVVSVCSLPYHFGVKLEDLDGKPYWKVPPHKPIEIEDEVADKLKVGFCWAGNPLHPTDMLRTIPMRLFKQFSDIDDVLLFSLQKDASANIRKFRDKQINLREGANGLRFIDITSFINSFADTAAWLLKMDVVVTIDTALAHLAGALGVPTWLMIPFANDWRWLKGGPDNSWELKSPWYDSISIYRQEVMESWTEPFDKATLALKDLIANPSSASARIRGDKTD